VEHIECSMRPHFLFYKENIIMSIISSSTELFYPCNATISSTSNAIDELSNTVSIMGVDFQDMVS
jgi:hypothetical protein